MPFWRNKDYNSGRWPTFVFGYLLTILEGLEFLGFLEWFFRPIAQIAGWNVPLSLMYTGDLSDSNV